MLLPFVMALTLTTMAHCDAVGRGIHAIDKAATRSFIVVFHVFCANTSNPEAFGIIRVLHMVNIPDVLGLAHFADLIWSAEVVDRRTCPTFVGNARQAPFVSQCSDLLCKFALSTTELTLPEAVEMILNLRT